EGVSRRLARSGYDLSLYTLNDGDDARQRVFDHFLLRGRLDAVITVSVEVTEQERGALVALNKPLVAIGGPLPGVSTLSVDNVAIAELATEHLIALGHTRIGYLGGSRELDVDFHVPTLRYEGFENAMRTAGLGDRADLIERADFTIPGGYSAAKQLLGAPRDRPTAIMAASDEMAIGALLAARDLGLRVPSDVSVIGIDDHDHARFFDLSTVAQFPDQQGEQAAQSLLYQLGEPAPTSDRSVSSAGGDDVALPFKLMVRGSTARPPQP
ncbi:MAG: LacI family DNA-binding transcriptional regulator, partial [Mycetocola sp.]